MLRKSLPIFMGLLVGLVGIAIAQQAQEPPPLPSDEELAQQCLMREVRWRQSLGNATFDGNQSVLDSVSLVSKRLQEAKKQIQDLKHENARLKQASQPEAPVTATEPAAKPES